jgi:hypothetical protein
VFALSLPLPNLVSKCPIWVAGFFAPIAAAWLTTPNPAVNGLLICAWPYLAKSPPLGAELLPEIP